VLTPLSSLAIYGFAFSTPEFPALRFTSTFKVFAVELGAEKDMGTKTYTTIKQVDGIQFEIRNPLEEPGRITGNGDDVRERRTASPLSHEIAVAACR